MTDHFLGYRRADGRVGVRNVVAILSAMDNTNPSAERIGSMVNGTAVLATPFGRGQIGADFEVTRRTLAGIAGHPNVAGVLVLSLSSPRARSLRPGCVRPARRSRCSACRRAAARWR